MRPYVETIEDLKANREEIIEAIMTEAETEDMSIVKAVMNQMVAIVTSSNYASLDWDVYTTIEEAVKAVKSERINVVDMGEINRKNAMANRPSSMR